MINIIDSLGEWLVAILVVAFLLPAILTLSLPKSHSLMAWIATLITAIMAVTVRAGKGEKDRMVPLGRKALESVGKYVKQGRPKLGAPGPETRELFLNAHGRPFGKGHLRLVLRTLGERSGIEGVTCHAIRRTMATDLLRAGASPKEVSAILGHSDLKSLSRYVRIAAAEVKETHRKTHPREVD